MRRRAAIQGSPRFAERTVPPDWPRRVHSAPKDAARNPWCASRNSCLKAGGETDSGIAAPREPQMTIPGALCVGDVLDHPVIPERPSSGHPGKPSDVVPVLREIRIRAG
jgi:hypothetical protein